MTLGYMFFTRPAQKMLGTCTVLCAHDQIGGTGGLSGEAVRGRWRERGWGEPERSLTRAALEAEAALPPAPFHSHKAGFVSIYLLGFSAKMLLEKHIALI